MHMAEKKLKKQFNKDDTSEFATNRVTIVQYTVIHEAHSIRGMESYETQCGSWKSTRLGHRREAKVRGHKHPREVWPSTEEHI